jgi:hypothetical protein
VDEFFDFWQASMNPAMIRTSQQNHFYKVLFKKAEKDQQLVKGVFNFFSSHRSFNTYSV